MIYKDIIFNNQTDYVFNNVIEFVLYYNQNINTFKDIKDDIILYFINNDNGFGSNLTVFIQNFVYFKSHFTNCNNKFHLLPHFSKNGLNFKYSDNKSNSFFNFFNYKNDISSKFKYFFIKLIYLDNIEFIQPCYDDDTNIYNYSINKLYTTIFNDNFEAIIYDKEHIDLFYNTIKLYNKPLIGIHLRALYQRKANISLIKNKTLCIDDILSKLKTKLDNTYKVYDIYVVSDVYEYIDKLINLYVNTNNRVLYLKNITRLLKDNNQDSIINFTNEGVKLGYDIMQECYLLGLCDYSYISVSNIVYITSFININFNHIHYS